MNATGRRATELIAIDEAKRVLLESLRVTPERIRQADEGPPAECAIEVDQDLLEQLAVAALLPAKVYSATGERMWKYRLDFDRETAIALRELLSEDAKQEDL